MEGHLEEKLHRNSWAIFCFWDAHNVIEMCEKSEFRLAKFISNSGNILLVVLEDKQYQKMWNQELEIADLLSSYLECTRIVKVVSLIFEYS